MSTHLTNIRRIEALEEVVRQLQSAVIKTADRTPIINRNRPVRIAETIDLGDYPADPATVFPIRFVDGTFTRTTGNQTPSYAAQSAAAMEVAYSGSYLAPNTRIKVFYQDGRWWSLEGGTSSPAEQQKTMYAYASALADFACTATVNATNVQLKPWGIFVLPWDEHSPTGGTASTMEFADGGVMQWSVADTIEWSEAVADAEWTFDNPFKYCGQKDDLLLLQYMGPTTPPIIVDVIRKCFTVDYITHDKVSGRTYQETYDICTQYSRMNADLLWDMNPEPVVTSVTYNQENCTVYYVTEEFMMITPSYDPPPGPNPVSTKVLNFAEDISEACCPCDGGTGTPIQTFDVVTGEYNIFDGAAGIFRDWEISGPNDDQYYHATSNIIEPFSTSKNTWIWVPIVEVPQGAVVVSARLTWPSAPIIGSARTVDIRAAAQNNAPRPTSTADILARPTTFNRAVWPMNTVMSDTVDFRSVVQEVVSRAGWASGNSMLLLIHNPDLPNFAETVIENGVTNVKFEVSFNF